MSGHEMCIVEQCNLRFFLLGLLWHVRILTLRFHNPHFFSAQLKELWLYLQKCWQNSGWKQIVFIKIYCYRNKLVMSLKMWTTTCSCRRVIADRFCSACRSLFILIRLNIDLHDLSWKKHVKLLKMLYSFT